MASSIALIATNRFHQEKTPDPFFSRRLPSPQTLHAQSCQRAALPRRGYRHRGTAVAGQRHATTRPEAKACVGSPRDGAVSYSGNVRNRRYPAGDCRLERWPRRGRLPDRRVEPVVDCAPQLAISARYRTIDAARDSRSCLRRGENRCDFNRPLMFARPHVRDAENSAPRILIFVLQ